MSQREDDPDPLRMPGLSDLDAAASYQYVRTTGTLLAVLPAAAVVLFVLYAVGGTAVALVAAGVVAWLLLRRHQRHEQRRLRQRGSG